MGFIGGLLVDKAVGEGVEELIGGVVLHQHPLAHGQRLCCRGGHHIALAGVDEDLSSTQPWSQHTLHATTDACTLSGCVFTVCKKRWSSKHDLRSPCQHASTLAVVYVTTLTLLQHRKHSSMHCM